MGRVVHLANTEGHNLRGSHWRSKDGRKRCLPTITFHWSCPAERTQKANQTPHQSREEEELWLSGPHHTVGSFHTRSCGCISMSVLVFFPLQYLTVTKIPRRIRITPHAPPTAAARMAISEKEAGSNKNQHE